MSLAGAMILVWKENAGRNGMEFKVTLIGTERGIDAYYPIYGEWDDLKDVQKTQYGKADWERLFRDAAKKVLLPLTETCAACGHRAPGNKKGRLFVCLGCGGTYSLLYNRFEYSHNAIHGFWSREAVPDTGTIIPMCVRGLAEFTTTLIRKLTRKTAAGDATIVCDELMLPTATDGRGFVLDFTVTLTEEEELVLVGNDLVSLFSGKKGV